MRVLPCWSRKKYTLLNESNKKVLLKIIIIKIIISSNTNSIRGNRKTYTYNKKSILHNYIQGFKVMHNN